MIDSGIMPGSIAPRSVAITGLGAVSALGIGVEALWSAITGGRDGFGEITRFDTSAFAVRQAAMVTGDFEEAEDPHVLSLRFGTLALQEASRHARLAQRPLAPNRIAVVSGTSLATHDNGMHHIAEVMADAIGAHGPRLTLSTACASSANAIGLGRDLILHDIADVVLVGGTDALSIEAFAGFHALGVLSPGKCAPFSLPPGTVLGEGAGFLVLERAASAQAHGVTVLGGISGYGLSCDAHHPTAPDPTGSGVAKAMQGALLHAGLLPGQIQYVNAHGTGTEANDPAEWRAVQRTCGPQASSGALAISSSKSFLGHAQGAAGVLEIIVTLLCMQRGLVPPTLNHVGSRLHCPADPVAASRPRPHPVNHALCVSSAFGGANAVVVLSASRSAGVAASPLPARPLWLLGAGIVGPSGLDAARRDEQAAPLAGPASWRTIPKLLAGTNLRQLDPTARLLTIATARALEDAGVSLSESLRERAGLFSAQFRVSPTSAQELNASIERRGIGRLSARAFTRIVLNASAGACARALGLRGPTTTLTTGCGSGLVALIYAAMYLSDHPDTDLLVATGVDEIDRDESPQSHCEGAVAVALTARAPSLNSTTALRIAGWGLAGPQCLDAAVSQALAMANLSSKEDLLFGAKRQVMAAPTTRELFHVVDAVDALRARQTTTTLLGYEGGSSVTGALVLEVIDET